MALHILIILIEKKRQAVILQFIVLFPPKENKQQIQHTRTVTRIMVSIRMAAIDQE